jgi:hypothetical protein
MGRIMKRRIHFPQPLRGASARQTAAPAIVSADPVFAGTA